MRKLIPRAADLILQYEWIVLALIALPLLFPSPNLTLVLLVLPILWSLHWWRSGSPFPRTALNLAMLLLALMVLVSLYATYSISFSLPKISGMLLGFGVFFMVVRFASSTEKWLYAIGFFLLAGLVLAVLGLMGGSWPTKIPVIGQVGNALPQVIAGLPGAEAGFHPNEISGALLWVVPGFWTLSFVLFHLRAQIFSRVRPFYRWASILLAFSIAISISAVLLMTQSRAGYIGLAAACPLILFLVLPNKFRAPVFLLILVLVVILGGWLLADTFQESQDGVLSEANASGVLNVRSMAGRFEIWSRALYGIQDFSFTGMGMNTFRQVVHVLYPLFMIAPDKDIGHAHNNFLQVALDLGIPGLIAYLAILMGSLVVLYRIWQMPYALPAYPEITRGLVLGLGGGLIAHSVYGLLDAVAPGAKPGILWWWLLGLIASLYRLCLKGSSPNLVSINSTDGQAPNS